MSKRTTSVAIAAAGLTLSAMSRSFPERLQPLAIITGIGVAFWGVARFFEDSFGDLEQLQDAGGLAGVVGRVFTGDETPGEIVEDTSAGTGQFAFGAPKNLDRIVGLIFDPPEGGTVERNFGASTYNVRIAVENTGNIDQHGFLEVLLESSVDFRTENDSVLSPPLDLRVGEGPRVLTMVMPVLHSVALTHPNVTATLRWKQHVLDRTEFEHA